jgi:uncharacterized protein
MTKNDITELMNGKSFPVSCTQPELVETHISYVIICDEYIFKIKKPIKYSFLDFSTLANRLYYCHREMQLNQRLTYNMYLEVLTIKKSKDGISMGKQDGQVIDYAIKMRKQNRERQMDRLLQANQVSTSHIQQLAEQISNFHRKAAVISESDPLSVQQKFNDLTLEKDFLREQLGAWASDLIESTISQSYRFIEENKDLLRARLADGFFRDVHGDLHSRNIFLLPKPVIFDCIEFNDEYRQIDVLNEVAFLCMDLDAFGKHELSDLFIKSYNELFPSMRTEAERKLFVYYKCYRANVRAKVNSLRAQSAAENQIEKKALMETEKYLRLMKTYLFLEN